MKSGCYTSSLDWATKPSDMTESNMEASKAANSWNAYWQGTGAIGAFSSGGANHPAILAFWNDFFNSIKQTYANPSLLDIASGNGAVIERALEVFEGTPIQISCADVSEAAISNIQSRFESVEGLVTDARSISLPDGAFQLVTSQFGVEYAGPEAITEATRLLADGGQLALLMHSESGSIHQECSANLDASTRFRDSDFIPAAYALFKTGFEAVRGADRQPYDEAGKRLAPAIQEAEEIMKQFGQGVADDTIAKLYGDVARIHGEIQQYDPEEVLSWLNKMETELDTYIGRMSSMVQAALNEDEFDRLCADLTGQDCRVSQAGPLLVLGNDIPLAWALLAHKVS